jgi:acyl-coenzyme A thioesterase PaaI-like protein
MDDSRTATPEGYRIWSHKDRFEDRNGPIFMHAKRNPPKGQGLLRFFAQERHTNGGNAVHGGMLLTFADCVMFGICKDEFKDHYGVTVTMNTEFLYPGWPDQWIEGDGEVIRATKSGLIFVRGQLFTPTHTLMTFSGVLKRIHPRKPG